ncbi:MAG TPA: hypothetical protein VEW91_01840, partial [bacterium]|nr:hypothetical protein [bacterium]
MAEVHPMARYPVFMRVALVFLGVILAGAPVTLAQMAGPVTRIDAPGATTTWLNGINAAGQIVGCGSDIMGGSSHGFVYAGGRFTTIDVPGAGANGTCANGINDVGQIVGDYYGPGDFFTGKAHGFMLAAGRFTTIDVPGAAESFANGINNAGQIVGYYEDAAKKEHGFMLAAGRFTTIDAPGATETSAYSINNSAQIVGSYKDAAGIPHGFLLAAGRFTTIDVPGVGTDYIGVFGINDAGQIVGHDGRGPYRGFVVKLESRAGVGSTPSARASSVTIATIDAPGAARTAALGINGAGQIVGHFMDAGGKFHGYLRTAGGTFTTFDAPGATRTA